jgi:NADH:ubiquinone oxidoreductase subunit E
MKENNIIGTSQDKTGIQSSSLPAEIIKFMEEASSFPHSESYLIAVLQKIQSHFGYLGKEHMDEVSARLRIPSAKVTGVATFYHFFSFVPKGKYRISVCLGTACYVKGAGRVLERFQELLGIGVGQSTSDKEFSLSSSRCFGACAIAPVVVINERVYGNVQAEDVEKILKEYGFSQKKK